MRHRTISIPTWPLLLQKRYGNGCCCRFPLQFPYPRTVPSCSTPDNESSKEPSDELCLFFCAGSFYHGSTDFSIEIEKFSEYLIVSPCVPPTAFLTEPFLTAEDFGIFLNTESCPRHNQESKKGGEKTRSEFFTPPTTATKCTWISTKSKENPAKIAAKMPGSDRYS